MNLNFHLYHKKGMSMVELMVASAVLALVMLAAVSGVRFLQSSVQTSHTLKAEQAVILNLVESVRSNPRSIQAFYSNNEISVADTLLSRDQLAIAWSPSQIVNVSECGDNCPKGRMGYVMQTVSGIPGLFLVTMHISENETDSVKVFKFFAGVR